MRKTLICIVMSGVVGSVSAAQAEEVVIAAFGDSLTQGFGLPVEDGFVPQMQRWLDGQGAEARLINAGVSGDTTAGGLARIGWTLSDDVDAMILALGANDVLRGLDPAKAKSNLEGILKAAQSAEVDVLLVGIQAGGNYGADYKAQFDAIYPDLAATYEVSYAESFFVGLMQDGALPPLSALLPMLQSDGLHPNATGVAEIVKGLGPHVLELVGNAQN